MASRKVSACARGASAPPPSGRHTSPSRFACHLPSRGGFEARRLRKRLPLRGAGAERLIEEFLECRRKPRFLGAKPRRILHPAPLERCYRTNGFPQGSGVCKGRFRAAALRAAHLSVTLRVPPPLEGRLKGASPEKKAPLEGSWRGAPERCCRTNGFPQSLDVCRGRFRAAALRAAHLSVTLRVPPLLKERLWGLSHMGNSPFEGAVSSSQKNQAPLGA